MKPMGSMLFAGSLLSVIGSEESAMLQCFRFIYSYRSNDALQSSLSRNRKIIIMLAYPVVFLDSLFGADARRRGGFVAMAMVRLNIYTFQ